MTEKVSYIGQAAAEARRFRSWRVVLDGRRVMWTVVDGSFVRHPEADAFLQHLQLAADAAESTGRAYAGDVALFLSWAGGGDLLVAVRRLHLFMGWLASAPIEPGRRGAGSPRSARRQARIVVAVREFYRFCAAEKLVDGAVLSVLFQVADDRFWPAHLRSEGAGLAYVARPRHRVRVPKVDHPDVCSQEEFEALLAVARTWRDRFLLVLLWFTGLRIGQALGLRREDLHLGPSSRVLGCSVSGPHLHVVRRANPNGAWSKSRHPHTVPVDETVIIFYEKYYCERLAVPGADDNPLLFVNVSKNRGRAMTTGNAHDLFARLSKNAGVRTITPHMLRHAFATTLRRGGAPLDVVQALLGHASLESTRIYNHPHLDDMRRAVLAVPAPGEPR